MAAISVVDLTYRIDDYHINHITHQSYYNDESRLLISRLGGSFRGEFSAQISPSWHRAIGPRYPLRQVNRYVFLVEMTEISTYDILISTPYYKKSCEQ